MEHAEELRKDFVLARSNQAMRIENQYVTYLADSPESHQHARSDSLEQAGSLKHHR
jgi:hypothetical protein